MRVCLTGRLKNRANYDIDTIHGIVNEALVSHVAFVDEEGLPQIIPMNAQVEEDEDGFYVLLHGRLREVLSFREHTLT